MLAAGELSIKYSKLDHQHFNLLKNVVLRLPLPKLPEFNSSDILKIMKYDKKVQSGDLNFVLLENIGKAVIHDNMCEESIINILEVL
jgi:3-dehydroquinate synthase